MIKKGLAYTLIALGFLVFLFFNKYTGTLIPYPFLFSLSGIALLLCGVFILRSSYTRADTKREEQIKARVDELKTNGTKIKVQLDDCELKEHHYVEERELYKDSQIQSLNILSGNAMKNVKDHSVNQVVVIYNYPDPVSGKIEKFVSPVINKDKQTLLFYLSRQKETFIYADLENKDYYFDLDFLQPALN